MKMVIGGAYQGKLSWAEENLWKKERKLEGHEKEETEGWIDGETCQEEDLYNCRGIYRFHRYLARFLISENTMDQSPLDSQSADVFAKNLLEKNREIIIVTDEIGYGIVPMDPWERSYREGVGRICTALAKESEEVYRVICGLGTRIK